MNSIWTDDAVRMLGSVDVAIAVNTDRGLMTPVVRNVAGRSVGDIAIATRDVAERARDSRLGQPELEGGSITVSNLGMFGIDEFAAIINPPQSAIIAVGAAREAAVVANGAVSVATLMQVVLSVDHRTHDGSVAAEWLGHFVDFMENPLTLVR
jgi:pyruvate dehydrogenase E2 component (dihydrolipoamide acetyltransferase)